MKIVNKQKYLRMRDEAYALVSQLEKTFPEIFKDNNDLIRLLDQVDEIGYKIKALNPETNEEL